MHDITDIVNSFNPGFMDIGALEEAVKKSICVDKVMPTKIFCSPETTERIRDYNKGLPKHMGQDPPQLMTPVGFIMVYPKEGVPENKFELE
jgi:hypothetical protein